MVADSKDSDCREIPWYTRSGFRKRVSYVEAFYVEEGHRRSRGMCIYHVVENFHAKIYEADDLIFEIRKESKHNIAFLRKMKKAVDRFASFLVPSSFIVPFVLLAFGLPAVLAIVPSIGIFSIFFQTKANAVLEAKEKLKMSNEQYGSDSRTLLANIVDIGESQISPTMDPEIYEVVPEFKVLRDRLGDESLEKFIDDSSARDRLAKLVKCGALANFGEVIIRFSSKSSALYCSPENIRFTSDWDERTSAEVAKMTQEPPEEVSATQATQVEISGKDGSERKSRSSSFPKNQDPSMIIAALEAEAEADRSVIGSPDSQVPLAVGALPRRFRP